MVYKKYIHYMQYLYICFKLYWRVVSAVHLRQYLQDWSVDLAMCLWMELGQVHGLN